MHLTCSPLKNNVLLATSWFTLFTKRLLHKNKSRERLANCWFANTLIAHVGVLPRVPSLSLCRQWWHDRNPCKVSPVPLEWVCQTKTNNESEANMCPNESEAIIRSNKSEAIMRPNKISIFLIYTRLGLAMVYCNSLVELIWAHIPWNTNMVGVHISKNSQGPQRGQWVYWHTSN